MKKQDRQKRKTLALAEMSDNGVPQEHLAVADFVDNQVSETEDNITNEIQQTAQALSEKIDNAVEELKKKSEDEESELLLTPEQKAALKGDPGEPGAPGKDYVLTEQDKAEIASRIKVPVVEKTTTTIREIPIIKEVAKPTPIPQHIFDSIDTLHGDILAIQEALKGGNKEVKIVGGTNGIFVYVDGVKKGIMKTLNFVGATFSLVNGMPTLTMAGGGANIESEKVTGVQNGAEVTLDLTTLAEAFTKVLWVSRNGQILTPNTMWSVSGDLLTIKDIVQADASEDFVVSYTY